MVIRRSAPRARPGTERLLRRYCTHCRTYVMFVTFISKVERLLILERRPLRWTLISIGRPTLVGIGLIMSMGARVGAQTVLGDLEDAGQRSTVAGALVVLEDEAGVEHVFGIADADGGFTLRSSRPGQYRLRVDRVGFESLWTGAFPLGAGDVREFQIPLPPATVTLHGLGSSAGPSCTSNHQLTPPTAMV